MAPLPEDVLLLVFRWLPPLELLRGPRAVCRAWRQAALHPSLWRSRYLRSDCPLQELLAVLRLAPCLRRLWLACDVYFPKLLVVQVKISPPAEGLDPIGSFRFLFNNHHATSHVDETLSPVLNATSCAVTELILELERLSPFYEVLDLDRKLLCIVRRQVQLGHLKTLVLKGVSASVAEYAIALVLEADLSDLCFTWQVHVPPPAALPDRLPHPARSPRPGLVNLVYGCFTASKDAFLEHLLETHAASLEYVKLEGNAPRRAVELLASCPKLRGAEVPAEWPEANSLSRCTHLQLLAVRVAHDKPPPLRDLFQSEVAAQLTQLTFLTEMRGEATTCVSGSSDVLQLVATVSASGRSALRELNLCAVEGARLERCWLGGVLRGPPRLHTLRAHSPITEAAMDCITPASAPGLRLLHFTSIGPVGHECGERHCSYLQSACRLVERNPKLHVMGLAARHACRGGQAVRCRWWQAPAAGGAQGQGDHGSHGSGEVPTPSCRRLSLYGHGDAEACGVPEHSGRVSKWRPPRCFYSSLYGTWHFNGRPNGEDAHVTNICHSYDDMHKWLFVPGLSPVFRYD